MSEDRSTIVGHDLPSETVMQEILARGRKLHRRRLNTAIGSLVVALLILGFATVGLMGIPLFTRLSDSNARASSGSEPLTAEVYVERGVTSSELESLEKGLLSLDGVLSVRYVSKEDSFKKLRTHSDWPDSWDDVSDVELPARFTVTLAHRGDVDRLRQRFENLAGVELITWESTDCS